MSAQQILVYVLGEKCVLCGSTEKLQLHHKDKNRTNNDLSNIQLLCNKCHRQIHGWQQSHPGRKLKNTSISIDAEVWEAWKIFVKAKWHGTKSVSEAMAEAITVYMQNHPLDERAEGAKP